MVIAGDKHECELQFLNGYSFTLEVQLFWTVAILKDRIEEVEGIPCYEQVLSDGSGKLQSSTVLRDVLQMQQDSSVSNFSLLVQRADLGRHDQLCDSDVQRIWEVFRMYSLDCGDTISRSTLGDMRGFLCHCCDDLHVCLPSKECEQLSFEALLCLIGKRKQALVEDMLTQESLDLRQSNDAAFSEILAAFELLDRHLEQSQRSKSSSHKTARSIGTMSL
eukprot:TRINITY_DN24295_c0_g1_i1.p1 TRINITY_DN24295_c0_g1~~TRINITY_DN24295_c0_g1_i1.p1  ORF type:complete len:220 (-),score=34.76 TRINITY_DN24295_c0_g1_i1:211-870(-)